MSYFLSLLYLFMKADLVPSVYPTVLYMSVDFVTFERISTLVPDHTAEFGQ